MWFEWGNVIIKMWNLSFSCLIFYLCFWSLLIMRLVILVIIMLNLCVYIVIIWILAHMPFNLPAAGFTYGERMKRCQWRAFSQQERSRWVDYTQIWVRFHKHETTTWQIQQFIKVCVCVLSTLKSTGCKEFAPQKYPVGSALLHIWTCTCEVMPG